MEFNAINVTWFSLKLDQEKYRAFQGMWRMLDANAWPGSGGDNVTLDALLMFDATNVLLNSYNRIFDYKAFNFSALAHREQDKILPSNFNLLNMDCGCPNLIPFEHGDVIARFLKAVSHSKSNDGILIRLYIINLIIILQFLFQTHGWGITGGISFDDITGQRKNFTLEVFQTSILNRVHKTAEWSDERGLVLEETHQRIVEQISENKTIYTVASILVSIRLTNSMSKPSLILISLLFELI